VDKGYILRIIILKEHHFFVMLFYVWQETHILYYRCETSHFIHVF